MNQLSDRLNSLSPSATLAMSQKSNELKAQGVDVINLSVGEPDFNTPDHIKEAAKKAIDDNFSRYSPVPGYPALRNAIVEKLKKENGLEYTAAQISCANGAKQSVCNTILVLVNPGDEVIVSVMEHHSNIVPWQLLAARKGIAIKVIPMNDKGELLLDEYEKLFSERTKIVSVVHVSNVLGTVNPVKEMIATAHAHGVPCLIDAAQSIPHMKVDVQELDADFLVFSAHKIYGPTGVGVLYGKEEWLDRLPPYQGGGEMIQHVSFEKTTFNELPFKFEAGTPDYIGTTGLAKALDYVNGHGIEQIAAHEHELTTYALQRLKEIPHIRLFGEAAVRGAVISFLVGDIHHFDLGTLLDRLGIAVRTGHHCAQPLMQRLGIEGTVRASFAMYNTKSEIDTLVAGIERVSKMF